MEVGRHYCFLSDMAFGKFQGATGILAQNCTAMKIIRGRQVLRLKEPTTANTVIFKCGSQSETQNQGDGHAIATAEPASVVFSLLLGRK
ncbi:predicted protein [Botrytis cinerea T4]|uniref:Uncharacterized protein n=1 Tax=Botryotinia fuckeliana (strain T4) TaxID=999810 RepID=G2XVC9_BOTF4|nr:predicted protein [Botrytis cinerea T4]